MVLEERFETVENFFFLSASRVLFFNHFYFFNENYFFIYSEGHAIQFNSIRSHFLRGCVHVVMGSG